MNIVITAGPTREYLDTIRFISNPSSGRMGYAIARAAAERGHDVTLVSGPVEVESPAGTRIIRVETAEEMLGAARRAFRRADAAIFTAAVCDWRPARRADRKLPKAKVSRLLRLVPTPDIAATLGRVKGSRLTIAFALEDHDGRRHAESKLVRKNCDAILLNGPGNIGSKAARFEYLARGGTWQSWPADHKSAIARRIIRALESMHALKAKKRRS
ncbi:MAG: hypothetical protein DCC65_08890 [Planctomycetota bacterium]|nr:MAG: hypothetical protein DCC65_08890 [Planctomycetota bacterium]